LSHFPVVKQVTDVTDDVYPVEQDMAHESPLSPVQGLTKWPLGRETKHEISKI